MKTLSIYKFLGLSAIVFVVVYACKKTETIQLQTPTACFTSRVTGRGFGNQYEGNRTYIDSNFYFTNCSDTTAGISYHWDFGDQTTSAERDPRHSYSKRGSYLVTLTVSLDGKVSDTATKTLTVFLGEKETSLGDAQAATPISIEETPSNDFVVLAAHGFSQRYSLLEMDSLLNVRAEHPFPANYYFNSLTSSSDGSYVLTGSVVSNTRSDQIVKAQASGNVLWSKTLVANDSYISAKTTSDGGLAVVGSRPVTGPLGNIQNYNVLIKTDVNGNIQWQKLLDQEGMINGYNAIIEPDGYVMAGVKRNLTGSCSDCDSVLIVKINNSGNVVWSNTVFWGLNTSNWWNTKIVRLTSGNYVVHNQYTRGVFYFSSNGTFLDRKILPNQINSVIGASDGNLMVLFSEFGNGNRMSVSKVTNDGAQTWNVYPDGSHVLPGGGTSCCASSWPVTMISLRTGGVLAAGYSYTDRTAILLMELNESGNLK